MQKFRLITRANVRWIKMKELLQQVVDCTPLAQGGHGLFCMGTFRGFGRGKFRVRRLNYAYRNKETL